MLTCSPYKMIPTMAPNHLMTLAASSNSRPKIGFSIDSIVGENQLTIESNKSISTINLSPARSSSSERPTSPFSDDCNNSNPLELRNTTDFRNNFNRNYFNSINNRNNQLQSIRDLTMFSNNRNNSELSNNESKPELPTRMTISPRLRSTNDSENSLISDKRHQQILSNSNSNSPSRNLIQNGPLSPESSVKSVERISPASSPTIRSKSSNEVDIANRISNNHARSNSPNANINNNNSLENKRPILVPGIPAGLIRPFPVQHGGPQSGQLTSVPHDMKVLNQSYMNGPPDMQPNPHHILAAQFQMAAALAHHGQAAAVAAAAGHPGFPHGPPPHHPQFGNPNVVRDTYPLYPWLLSRHGRIFPHRFPGHFLLQPFRKPKRVRTAFSPTQLLKLEHAFEGNHYVVGAERKTLAQQLNLTETQVKVWFQNRRTKHKRMQQEDDAKGEGSGRNNSPHNSYDEEEEDDDELIDMEMDECPSDQEMDHMYHH